MNLQTVNYVTPADAAMILGISERVLLLISQKLGLGHSTYSGAQSHTYFTYEDISEIFQLASEQVH